MGEEALGGLLQISALPWLRPTSAWSTGEESELVVYHRFGLNRPPHVATALGTTPPPPPRPGASSLTDRSGYLSLLDQWGLGAACQEGDKGPPMRKE